MKLTLVRACLVRHSVLLVLLSSHNNPAEQARNLFKDQSERGLVVWRPGCVRSEAHVVPAAFLLRRPHTFKNCCLCF